MKNFVEENMKDKSLNALPVKRRLNVVMKRWKARFGN